jgi:hypothetical protein
VVEIGGNSEKRAASIFKLRDGDLHKIGVDLFKMLNVLFILMVWNDLDGSI